MNWSAISMQRNNEGFTPYIPPCKEYLQWGQYVFDPLANYENSLLVEKGT